MAGMTNGNGTSRAWCWLLGALLVPLLLASFGNLLHTTYSSAERVSGLEAAGEAVQRQLQRIERKLDQLLERR
jgi:hypothetical protein